MIKPAANPRSTHQIGVVAPGVMLSEPARSLAFLRLTTTTTPRSSDREGGNCPVGRTSTETTAVAPAARHKERGCARVCDLG